MGKKNKLSKLSDADEEKLSKLSKKERSLAVEGKPDATDIQMLDAIFSTYKKAAPGMLRYHISDIALERAAIRNLPSIETAERFTFSLPQDLEEVVRHWFPSIWTNKEHARWFVKNYPQFRKG